MSNLRDEVNICKWSLLVLQETFRRCAKGVVPCEAGGFLGGVGVGSKGASFGLLLQGLL